MQFVEPGDQIGAETGGDRAARAQREIADAPQPGAGKLGRKPRRDAERRRRQIVEYARESLAFEAGGGDRLTAEASERRSRARRIGEAHPQRQPDAGEARFDVRQQPGLVAEQMGDAGDIEHQPVGAIERHQRREARAGVGELCERLRLSLGVGLDGDEGGMAGAGVGERQAGAEAQTLGRRIDADQPARVLLRGDDGERGLRGDLMRATREIGRQARQPQRQISPVRQTFAPRFARSAAPPRYPPPRRAP